MIKRLNSQVKDLSKITCCFHRDQWWATEHGKRSAKNIAEAEYYKATESLQEDGFGRIVLFSVPRAHGQCKVFVKSKPEPWPNSATVTDQEFDSALSKPIHSDNRSNAYFFTSKQLHFILETMASSPLPFMINFFKFAFKLIETSWEVTCSIRITIHLFRFRSIKLPMTRHRSALSPTVCKYSQKDLVLIGK